MDCFIELENTEQTHFLRYIALHVDKQPTPFKSYFAIRRGESTNFFPGYGEYQWLEPLPSHSAANPGSPGLLFTIHYKEEGPPLPGENCNKGPSYFKRLRIFHPTMQPIKDFVSYALQYVDRVPPEKVSVYTSNSKGYWSLNDNTYAQSLDNIYLPAETKTEILGRIDNFVKPETRERFKRFGRKHKLGLMFTGVPGSGKSSLALAIAKHYARPIYMLNISRTLSDEPLTDLISEIKNDSILLIEDVDCYFEDRKAVDVNIGFSCFLNVLDGCVAANNGLITIMTANNPKNLDPALTRPGRMDRIIIFDYPTRAQHAMAFKALTAPTPADDDDNDDAPDSPDSQAKAKAPDSQSESTAFTAFYDKIRGTKISMAGIVDYLFYHQTNYMDDIKDLLASTKICATMTGENGNKNMYI